MQAVLSRAARRSMSSTAAVWVDKNTKLVVQGFTGEAHTVSERAPRRAPAFFARGTRPATRPLDSLPLSHPSLGHAGKQVRRRWGCVSLANG
jgi:hypothetical protein